MEKLNKEEIGKRIFNIRASLGETMEEFSKHFSTNRSTINNWEKGRNLPNKSNLLVLSELSGLTSNELLYGTTEEQQQIQKQIELYNRVKDVANNYLKDIEIIEKYMKKTSGMLGVFQEIEDKIYEALDKFDSSPDEAKAILSELSYAIENYISAEAEDLEGEEFRIYSAKHQLEFANKKIEELNKD